MKPFRLSRAQLASRDRDLRTKDRIALDAQKQMDRLYDQAVNDVISNYRQTKRYKDPDLDHMDKIFEQFYRKVITAGVKSCDEHRPTKKRLAALPPGNLPTGPRALNRVLTDRKFWRRILRRKDALVGNAKRALLDRLRKHFRQILPILELGDMSPRDIKKQMQKAVDAPKARVSMIFQTETTFYFAHTQIAYFKDSPLIIGFLFDSVRDTSRTLICQCRHGLVLKPGSKALGKMTPPLHYNCRSHLLPLVDDHENRKMANEPARDPANRELVPVMRGFGKS